MSIGPPLLVLRADADAKIGTGHVMRCLALAQAWRDLDGEALFRGRIESEPLGRRLEAEGFAVHHLTAPYPDPQDLESLLAWLGERKTRDIRLVTDGYHLAAPYHQAIRATGRLVVIVDDYAHLPSYHADLLVNPNAYGPDLHYATDPDTQLLLGSRYAMLRREFRQAGQARPDHGRPGRRLLITMGGADPDNVTAMVLDVLQSLAGKDLEVKVVLGALNPHQQAVRDQVRRLALPVELLTQVSDMPPLMQWADLAISAAGSTCWELAALGVPMALIVLADNQERLAASLAEHGAAVNLGWHQAWQPEQAAAAIQALLANPARLQEMARQGRRLVDGLGAVRLARAIRAARFSLRAARPDDCALVFRWANDPLTRAVSFQPESIAWPGHCQWFDRQLADPRRLFFIAVDEQGLPLGQVRFNLADNNEAEISISLDADYRGLGLGPRLIRRACRRLTAERSPARIRALVKTDNPASLQAFTRAGFRQQGTVKVRGQAAIAMTYLQEDNAT